MISNKNLLYFISKKEHNISSLKSLLLSYPEIQFVSLVGIDLGGNDTDEKIPINIFLNNINNFLKNGIQTDGSSVVLPGIATLNNGKVDLIPDTKAKWFIDYNYENFDLTNKKPIGTLRIPCFLKHNNTFIDCRSILKQTNTYFKKSLLNLFDLSFVSEYFNIKKNDIASINLTTATELEFWVRTPDNNNVKFSDLSASEIMQEQYWKRTKLSVRTALEKSLKLLERYGLQPEMGHKEVGGIKARLTSNGTITDIMEQLEIDWKYDESLQSADNELLARTFIKETFQAHGLDVSFKAKPIDGIAGSGEHTHIGISLTLKDGKSLNLFNDIDFKNNYLSIIGWGSLLGILKNYEILNPFINSTNDSLERLKPGFEAPVCIVASIGKDINTPSRNRTVLLGLIRNLNDPLATRFEIRSPSPHSNTYLVIATLYLAMLDGINYAINSKKTTKDLELEFKKIYGQKTDYLEKNRMYHTESDVFEKYTENERELYFGKHPQTVWENLENITNNKKKLNVLLCSKVFNEQIISSYCTGVRKRWLTEITNRFIPKTAKQLSKIIPIHKTIDSYNKLDEKRWLLIQKSKEILMKDNLNKISLFTKIRQSIKNKNYSEVSKLQIEIQKIIKKIKKDFIIYKRNILML